MARISEAILCAFRDELSKTAGFADVVARGKPMLKNIGSAAGVGALAGAGLGGLSGVSREFRTAREEGAGTGEAALRGALGGLSGAARGGAYGALAGGGMGALGARLGGDPSRLVARNDIIGSAARAGQRQVHSLTGMLSPEEFEGVRGGAYGVRKHLSRLEALGKPTGRAAKGLAAAEEMQRMGATSVPGVLGALKNEGVGKVLSTGAKEQAYNLPTVMTGLTAYGVAKPLLSKEDPSQVGPGKGERVGRAVGSVAGGAVGGLVPFTGGQVIREAAGRAGGGVGRVIDRIRGRRPMVNDLGNRATTLEPTESQNTPSERVTSPSAAGGQKDIGL
jgi:hypothetical protein